MYLSSSINLTLAVDFTTYIIVYVASWKKYSLARFWLLCYGAFQFVLLLATAATVQLNFIAQTITDTYVMCLENTWIVVFLFTQRRIFIYWFRTDWNTFFTRITSALLQVAFSLLAHRFTVLIFPLNWLIHSLVFIGSTWLSMICNGSGLSFALFLVNLFLNTFTLLMFSLRSKMRCICLPSVIVAADAGQNSAFLFVDLGIDELSIIL